MTRLVCRSAPLPTKHIAEQMRRDAIAKWNGEEFRPPRIAVTRCTLSTPAQTDNAQCWSEEFFSFTP